MSDSVQSNGSARRRSGPGSGGASGNGFKPGKSGNPGGRPKGLAARVRELAPEDDLARWQWAIWTFDKATLKRLGIKLADVTLAERMKAHEWLTERGHGKAPAFAPIEGGDPLERDEADRALAAVADELAARRQARGVGGEGEPDSEAADSGGTADGAVAADGAD